MSKNICQKSIVSLLKKHIGIDSTVNFKGWDNTKNR